MVDCQETSDVLGPVDPRRSRADNRCRAQVAALAGAACLWIGRLRISDEYCQLRRRLRYHAVEEDEPRVTRVGPHEYPFVAVLGFHDRPLERDRAGVLRCVPRQVRGSGLVTRRRLEPVGTTFLSTTPPYFKVGRELRAGQEVTRGFRSRDRDGLLQLHALEVAIFGDVGPTQPLA